jgi:hypothetical protein
MDVFATGQRSTDPAARIIEQWAADYVTGSPPPSGDLYPGAIPYLSLGTRYAPVTRLPDRCFGNPLPQINGLAVHCTGGAAYHTAFELAQACLASWNTRVASAHFAIAGDGTVVQFIPASFSAFAQGNPADQSWLSVEIANLGLDPPANSPANSAQIAAAQKLFGWISRGWSIRPEVAAGHLCADRLRTPLANAYDAKTAEICSQVRGSVKCSSDETVAQRSRGLSCHRWLQPYVKACPGVGLLAQLPLIAAGA